MKTTSTASVVQRKKRRLCENNPKFLHCQHEYGFSLALYIVSPF